jgi:hypothetical protein
MVASIHLSIVPKYDIQNGGQHGTSLGSEIPLELEAGETKHWVGDAGQPEGVTVGSPIADCKPRLYDIDIG